MTYLKYNLSPEDLTLQKKFLEKFPTTQTLEGRKDLTIFPVSATLPNHPEYIKKINEENWNYHENPSYSGWTRSELNLDGYVQAFSHLRLKDGFKLRGYVYGDGFGGHGRVWAIPETKELPEPIFDEENDKFYAPPPEFGIEPMKVIVGDGTPISYLQAAILSQELSEFGAFWHGVSWGVCEILPHQNLKGYTDFDIDHIDPTKWSKNQEPPATWFPHFYRDEENLPIIVFYIYHPVISESIIQCTFTFERESYNYQLESTKMLVGPGGIIF